MGFPYWKELNKTRSELKQYTSLISSSGGYDKIKTEILQKNVQLKRKVEKLSSGVSDSRDLSSLLEMLIGKASAADIQFVKMQPQPEEKKEDMLLYPVVLEITTTYHALGRFVSSLETLPHLIRINRLAINANKSGKLNVKILVTCYLQPEDAL